MSRSAERNRTSIWTADDEVGGPLDEVFRKLWGEFPELSIERLRMTHPADDDNVWWLTLNGADSDVQIDAGQDGVPPFILESDTERIDADTVVEAATTLRRWLQALDR